jgi:adenosylcobyric acid synthase
MALNSFATPDGDEIGRAQAMQAEAAGVAPTTDMNPILLKPEGHARSQVVVRGRIWASLEAVEYQRQKAALWPIAEESLHRLLEQFDLVVIEGAGSPAEVNLKADDIANMRVARAARAPVLLVGDIDRGGVFASLLGTMELLDAWERELVAGVVINKFRGDPSLLEPGIRFLEQRLARPVLGIVPWIEDLGLAEEDSQGLPTASQASAGAVPSVVDVVILRLPRIANFDDFDPLARRAGVRVRFVDDPQAFGAADLVILPGSKGTRADLRWLCDAGLGEAIRAHTASGGAVIGICGGYQMLGEQLEDPEGVEGPPGSMPGLRLLPAVTRFAESKTTVQVQARVAAERGLLSAARGSPVSGYEIHMGQTLGTGAPVFEVVAPAGQPRGEGLASADGWTRGTYLHGLFHNADLLEALLATLARRKGVALPPASRGEDPYDRLAGVLRESLDMAQLHQLAGV